MDLRGDPVSFATKPRCVSFDRVVVRLAERIEDEERCYFTLRTTLTQCEQLL